MNILKDIQNTISEKPVALSSAPSLPTSVAGTKDKSCQRESSLKDETCTEQNVELSSSYDLMDNEEESNSNRKSLKTISIQNNFYPTKSSLKNKASAQNKLSSSNDSTDNEEEINREQSEDELELKIDNSYQLYGKEWDDMVII